MIKITLFKNIYAKVGVVKQGTFQELVDVFKDSVKLTDKEKEGNLDTIKIYNNLFVRGECLGSRKDANCKLSNLIVIDADKGISGRKTPKAENVHMVLKDLGINHFIYTSWSNMVDDKHKYRVLVPCKSYSRVNLKNINKEILELLRSNGQGIAHVKEMDSFSQPWFYGRHVEQFEYFEYYGGSEFEWSDQEIVDDASAEEVVTRGVEGLSELYENIRTGKEYHESMRTISFQLVKDGMSKAHCKEYLKTLMNGSKEAGTDRWHKRYEEIDRLVEGIYDGDNEFKVTVDNKEVKLKCIPKAPGLLGKFISELEEFMNYRDETIAFMSGIFIVASIIGRKFNVDINDGEGYGKPTALNMYLTLAAETGSGKSEIEDSVENCYMQFSGTNGCIQDFFYKGRVSGPRALYKRYLNQRSIGFIMNEKGIAGQSQLGDVAGMKDAWLNLYGQGAWNKYSGEAGYTDSDTDIKKLRGVAISYIGESTPVELRKAYSKGDMVANGTIPREMIFVIGSLNVKPNRNLRRKYSPDVVDKFNALIGLSAAEVACDLFRPVIITSADETDRLSKLDIQEYYRVRQNEGESVLERAMSSRAFVKMLRLAGLATAVNYDIPEDGPMIIGSAEWAWAKSVVEYEYANMENIVNLTNGSDDIDLAVNYAIDKIRSILLGTTKDSELKIPKKEMDMKIIPCTYLKKAIRYSPLVRALDGGAGGFKIVKGVDKVIDYLIQQKVITKPYNHPLRRGECYRVLENINGY